MAIDRLPEDTSTLQDILRYLRAEGFRVVRRRRDAPRALAFELAVVPTSNLDPFSPAGESLAPLSSSSRAHPPFSSSPMSTGGRSPRRRARGEDRSRARGARGRGGERRRRRREESEVNV